MDQTIGAWIRRQIRSKGFRIGMKEPEGWPRKSPDAASLGMKMTPQLVIQPISQSNDDVTVASGIERLLKM